ncbi:hypothetical protein IQ06DRAFT_340346 [Phaeosphaeriaceae sp. SRC1lsM3a]|nr:hypothetical protein IQ06DRAFT_340346 [Stagonospora sp. SRC1lsM3a]
MLSQVIDSPLAFTNNATWSKEAIIAFATIFVMVFLSSLGIVCKYRTPIRRLVMRLFSRLIGRDKERLLFAYRRSHWAELGVVRESQQRTYTSEIRKRRGPAARRARM